MKFYLVSLGCAKNLVDSEVIIHHLEKAGHEWVTGEDLADAVIITTCCFIESAKTESVETILEFTRKKKRYSYRVFVGGCLPSRYGRDLLSLIPEVDGWFGIEEVTRVSELIEKPIEEGPAILVSPPGSTFTPYQGRRQVTPSHWAYLKIADGCDHQCSFCVIPSIRGPYRSRHIEALAAEASVLAAAGVRELVLVAQDTGLYGKDLYGRQRLPELLVRLEEIEGLRWIRLLYINPHSLGDELICFMESSVKMVRYLDIPFQHASREVLKRMRRPGGRDEFLALIEGLRGRVPGLALRSTFITGFPGETQQDFQELLDFLRDARLARAGFFSYSREEGSRAYSYEDNVPGREKERRHDAAMRLQRKIAGEVNYERLGKTVAVMIEKKREQQDTAFLKGITAELGNPNRGKLMLHDIAFIGRSEWDSPDVDGVVLLKTKEHSEGPVPSPGDIVEAGIEAVSAYDALGTIK
ncbi:MAG: 30S ribosomal protein S12 methylthiotransferase RimO [Candidatus Eremiobacteraeota bacterium]|nr:30S ribosomal protein S12 methylthiotransferase RimO [Candidatus Eremiobacteraeota bacterium]